MRRPPASHFDSFSRRVFTRILRKITVELHNNRSEPPLHLPPPRLLTCLRSGCTPSRWRTAAAPRRTGPRCSDGAPPSGLETQKPGNRFCVGSYRERARETSVLPGFSKGRGVHLKTRRFQRSVRPLYQHFDDYRCDGHLFNSLRSGLFMCVLQ